MVCTESTIEDVGLHRLDVAEHGRQVGLGGEVEVVGEGADPLGPQPHLGRRLLAGDDQAAARRPSAILAAALSSSVDLPTPGSPASSTTEPGTSPPPRTRSSSGSPVGRWRAASAGTLAIGRAGALTGPATTRSPGLAAPTSSDRAPGLALGAAADPLAQTSSAALVAPVRRPVRGRFHGHAA